MDQELRFQRIKLLLKAALSRKVIARSSYLHVNYFGDDRSLFEKAVAELQSEGFLTVNRGPNGAEILELVR